MSARHLYSSEDDRRMPTIILLVVLSVVIAVGLSTLVAPYLDGWIAYLASFSVVGIFDFLIFIVPRSVLLWISGTPNINGHYTGYICSSFDGHLERYPVELNIDQTILTLEISFIRNGGSHSTVISSHLRKSDKVTTLIYTYLDNGIPSVSAATSHLGTAQLFFNQGIVSGSYFTDEHRKTYGTISLQRSDSWCSC